MKLTSILTVLDRPSEPPLALEKSAEMQALSDADVSLIAFRYNAMYDHAQSLTGSQRKSLRHQVVEEAQCWREALVAKSDLDASKTQHRTVWSKDIATWLADELASEPRDMVIKTLHPSNEFLYTPLDWKILRTSPAPVMLLSNRQYSKSKKILAALDFSQSSAKYRRLNNKVLQAASALAELHGATLHCVFALQISKPLRDLDIVDGPMTKKKLLAKLSPEIERTLAPFNIAKSNRHFPIAKAGDAIRSKAHKLNADLVVMGSSPHRLKQMVGLGGTAEKILSKLQRDVLVVHP